MADDGAGGRDDFAGVDLKLLEQALSLIRDKFRLATEANVFLERKTRVSGINIGIANQRDVTSHLASLLKTRGTDAAARRQQETHLRHMEEHMRRAVMEPYERTVQLLTENLLKQIEDYRKNILSHPRCPEAFPNAPTLQELNAALDAVDQLCAEGRLSKLENAWTDAWELGVKKFVVAVTDLEKLIEQIEVRLVQAEQLRRHDELMAHNQRLADQQFEEARRHAQRGKRRAYLLLPVSALLGLGLKIAWDWYHTAAP
jgi:hypothetical protein